MTPSRTPLQVFGAFSIHIITASGAGAALMAMLAATNAQWSMMFVWLGVALFLDGIDGPLARRIALWDYLPRWSGETLDLVVDFVTYVFVPAYAMVASGLLPPQINEICGIAIVVTSALYFADKRMKTKDNYFLGFPAIWNAAAFYLFLIEPDPWAGAAAIIALVVLTFVPMPFIHPVRVVRLRTLNMALLVLWSSLVAVALLHDMQPGPVVTGILCVMGFYIMFGGLLRRSPKTTQAATEPYEEYHPKDL